MKAEKIIFEKENINATALKGVIFLQTKFNQAIR